LVKLPLLFLAPGAALRERPVVAAFLGFAGFLLPVFAAALVVSAFLLAGAFALDALAGGVVVAFPELSVFALDFALAFAGIYISGFLRVASAERAWGPGALFKARQLYYDYCCGQALFRQN
jgi:hypothetical protein